MEWKAFCGERKREGKRETTVKSREASSSPKHMKSAEIQSPHDQLYNRKKQSGSLSHLQLLGFYLLNPRVRGGPTP